MAGPEHAAPLDALVIGAGPAGLTAATYLARYRRDILVVDGGRSRARYIPESRNCPGFPGGIEGVALLDALREQAARHHATFVQGTATKLERHDGRFVATVDGDSYVARSIVIATGIVDVLPPLDGVVDAIHDGLVRLCAICDGYEASARRVVVYGPAGRVVSHALFLRGLCADVTVALAGDAPLPEPDRAECAAAGIAVLGRVDSIRRDGEALVLAAAGGDALRCDALYPVLGSRSQGGLALALGADCDENGELVVDAKQRTTIEGVYAIGDVVSAINQISVAFGHAAIAATTLHNALPRVRFPADGLGRRARMA